MVSMNTCRLLLGRLWQYDWRVVHAGHKSTYSLTIKRKMVNLAHHRKLVVFAPKVEKRTNLPSMARFCEEAEKKGVERGHGAM